MLWLHAYKYSIPMELWKGKSTPESGEEDTKKEEDTSNVKVIKTEKPEWASQSYSVGEIREGEEENGASDEEQPDEVE